MKEWLSEVTDSMNERMIEWTLLYNQKSTPTTPKMSETVTMSVIERECDWLPDGVSEWVSGVTCRW